MKISEIISKNEKAIGIIDVVIPVENNQSKISVRGTGFVISEDGRFITCAHVYKQVPENEKKFLGIAVVEKMDEKGLTFYKRHTLELVKIDEVNDIALLQIVKIAPDEKFTPIQDFGDIKNIYEGEELVFIGFPLATELLGMKFGITLATNHCILSSVKRRGADGSLNFFMIDTHTNNGSSGSPVFSRDNGKLIGMISGKISAKVPAPDGKVIDIPANMGICRPVNYIKDILK